MMDVVVVWCSYSNGEKLPLRQFIFSCHRSSYPSGAVTIYGMNLLSNNVTIMLPPHLQRTPIMQYLFTPHEGDLTSK